MVMLISFQIESAGRAVAASTAGFIELRDHNVTPGVADHQPSTARLQHGDARRMALISHPLHL
jgi:hypothetical protein